MTDKTPEKPRFLDSPGNVRRLFAAFVALCALLFLADALYRRHATFAWEGWFGFYPLYGLIGVSLLVILAKGLRRLVKRREDYYDD